MEKLLTRPDGTLQTVDQATLGPLTNITNALTFGFGDEAVSGGNALIDALTGDQSIGDAYDDRLAQYRGYRKHFRENNTAGALATDILGGWKVPVSAALRGAKGLGSILFQTAKEGAKLGGLYGFGESEGGIENRAKGAGTSALVTALLSPAAAGTIEGLRSLSGFLTKGGRNRAAGEILNEVAGKEGKTNLAGYSGSQPYGERTFAEVAQTPDAASFEKVMRSEPGLMNELMTPLQERQGERVAALESLIGDAPLNSVTPDVRGSTMREMASPVLKKAEKKAAKLWNEVEREGQTIDVTNAIKETKKAAAKLDGPLGFSSDAKKVLSYLEGEVPAAEQAPKISSILDQFGAPIPKEAGAVSGAPLTVDEFTKLRSAAGEVMADAAGKGRNREAALMASVREFIDGAASKAAEKGTLESGNLSNLGKAIGATRKLKTTFESGSVGNILQKGEGGFRVRDEQVPFKVVQNATAAKQFTRAFGDKPELMEQARGHLLDEMTKKGPDTWPDFFKKREAEFKVIFGDDYGAVADVVGDLASEKSVDRLAQLATGRGSITAQKVAGKEFLESRTAKLLMKSPDLILAAIGGQQAGALGIFAGGIAGHFIGTTAEQISRSAQGELKKIIVRALRDPEFARTLMKGADRAVSQKFAQVVPRLLAAPLGNKSADRSLTGLERKQLSRKQPAGSDPSRTPTDQPQEAPPRTGKNAPSLTPTSYRPVSYSPAPRNFNKAFNSAYDKAEEKLGMKTPKNDSLAPLFKAVTAQESRGKPGAVSPKGATGLMQVMPDTAKEIAKDLGIEKYDLKDPAINKMFGEHYLKKKLKAFHGDVELALASYNAGEERVRKWIRRYGPTWDDIKSGIERDIKNKKILPGYYRETLAYVPGVLSRINKNDLIEV